MPQLVQGEGNRNAKIWLIGEAPGEQEEKQGRPFIGGAGKVLDGILHEVGIQRSDTYIDNVIQRRPPENNFNIFYKDKGKKTPTDELLAAHQRVRELIKAYKPNIVVALGNEALRALTEKNQITHWRGSLLECEGVKVLPVIQPTMVMKQYEHRPSVVLDLHKAKAQSLSPYFPPPYKDNFRFNLSFEETISVIRELHEKEYIAFDIETSQELGQIMCIGFGTSKEEAVCIPIFYSKTSWWTAEEEIAIIKEIRELFAIQKIKFIAQNAQFDLVYLADKWGIDVDRVNLWMDTMIAFHCVYPELKKGLSFLTSIYTNRPYYKNMPGSGGGPDVLWTYNCLDTVVTYECAMELRKELDEFKTLRFYEENSHKLIKAIIQMQRRGIKIDLDRKKKIDEALQMDLEVATLRLQSVVGYTLNPASPKQMKEFLYEDLGLPPVYKKNALKQQVITADEDALETLDERYNLPILKLIIDIRHINKLLSTYIRAELEPDDRLKCAFIIGGNMKDEFGEEKKGGTETGRLSSRSNVYGRGTNLQNIPRGDLVRSIFIPDPGCVFINADLNKAEARAVAYLAREERLRNMLDNTKEDFYKFIAATFFKKGVAAITDSERQTFKSVVHAANYMVGETKLGKTIGCPKARARELLDFYYALCPSIKCWHMEIKSTLSKSKILRTPLGRARMFFGRWGDDLIREGVAYVPQSTVSDIINLGIIRAYPNLPPGWEILLQIHDAILMQVPIETPPMHIQKFVKHYLEIPVEINDKMMTIPIDIKVGMNWAKMAKLEV